MIVSIHQPNYLPWLGFFDKVIKSDVFVVMDDVQFPRGKNHFGHRNLIKTETGSKWLTLPLKGKGDFKKFNEIELNYDLRWCDEHINGLAYFYRKAKYTNDYLPALSEILRTRYNNLSNFNMTVITYLFMCLGITTEVVYSSRICPDATGADRISAILKTLKADKYISGTGPGSLRYINEEEFKKDGIELIWQHYQHPTYTQQHGDFIPLMSVVDLLFNEGEKSKEIIRL
jgi:hypothetical protein